MIIAISLLTLSFVAFLWIWIGYPLHLRSRRRRWSLTTLARDQRPSVSIIIAAFNQEATILRKLRNTLSLDYPRNLMEVLVVSDGSTDRTNELVSRIRDPRVRLVPLPRTGRLAALQQGALRAHGEVLVFTDASVSIEPSALRALMRNFADPHVGGATGAVDIRRRRNGDSMAIGESLYTRYDNWVRGLESMLGSVHAAERGLYAIRRTLMSAPRTLAQSDDMAFSTNVVLQGRRLVHEPAARARRDAPHDGAREMRRRVHITNYALRSISEMKWRLMRRPGYAFQLLSSTAVRNLSPFCLATMLVCAGILAPFHPAFVWALGAQAAGYVLALLGWKLRRTRLGRFPLLALPAWFASFNIASFLGLVAWFMGRRPTGATPRRHASTGATPRRLAAAEATPLRHAVATPSARPRAPRDRHPIAAEPGPIVHAVAPPPVSAII